jgi:hypothetical protein
MKRITLAIALLLAVSSIHAQSITIDAGGGNQSIIDAPSSGGVQHYPLSGEGGTILSTTSAFPTQSGHNGNYLTTNGSALSWGSVSFGNGGGGNGTHFLVGHVSGGIHGGDVSYACLSGLDHADGHDKEEKNTVTMPYAGTITGLHVRFDKAPNDGTGTQAIRISVWNLTQNTFSGYVEISEDGKTGLDSNLNLAFAIGDQLTLKFQPIKTGGTHNPKDPGEVSYGVRIHLSDDNNNNAPTLSGAGVANQVTYWSSANNLTSSANLTNDGTTVAAASGGSTTLDAYNSASNGTAAHFSTSGAGGVALKLDGGKMLVSMDSVTMPGVNTDDSIYVTGKSMVTVILDNADDAHEIAPHHKDKPISFPWGASHPVNGQMLYILNMDNGQHAKTGGGQKGADLDNSAKELGCFFYFAGTWHRLDQ